MWPCGSVVYQLIWLPFHCSLSVIVFFVHICTIIVTDSLYLPTLIFWVYSNLSKRRQNTHKIKLKMNLTDFFFQIFNRYHNNTVIVNSFENHVVKIWYCDCHISQGFLLSVCLWDCSCNNHYQLWKTWNLTI